MKKTLIILLILMAGAGYSQNVTSTLGNNDGTSSLKIVNSGGSSVAMKIDDKGTILSTGTVSHTSIRIVTGGTTATVNDYTIIEKSTSNSTITLPSSPPEGMILNIADATNTGKITAGPWAGRSDRKDGCILVYASSAWHVVSVNYSNTFKK